MEQSDAPDATSDSPPVAEPQAVVEPAMETYFAAPAEDGQKPQEEGRPQAAEVDQQEEGSVDGAANADQAPPLPAEISVEFGEGALGLTMRRTRDDVVVVHSIAADTQAESKGLVVGDRILQLGSFDLRSRRIDKEIWKRAIEHVKNCPRPLAVVYERAQRSPKDEEEREDPPPPPPQETAPAPSSPPPLAPLSSTSAGDMGVYARKRSLLAKRQLSWTKFGASPCRGRALVDSAESHLVFDGAVSVWRQPQRFRALMTLVRTEGSFFQPDRYALLFKRERSLALVVAAIEVPTEVDGGTSDNKWRLPDSALEVERCISLDACKLRRDSSRMIDEGAVFEIAAPDGDFVAAVESEEVKSAWLSTLATEVLASARSNGFSSPDNSLWRQHVLLGTPLSLAVEHAVPHRRRQSSSSGIDNEASFDDEELMEMLAGRCRVDFRDAQGRTALHVAASRGATEVVGALLEAGADRDAYDARRSTPLHEAARGWHDASVSLLLSASSKKKQVDTFEESEPAFEGSNDVVASLLEARDADGATAIIITAKHHQQNTFDGHRREVGDVERLSRTLLALSAWGGQLDARDGSGMCLVHLLAESLQADELDIVCRSCGVDPKTKLLASPKTIGNAGRLLRRGSNALHCAFAGEIVRGDGGAHLARCCDVLVRHGCNPYDVDADGHNAIELAFATLEQTGDYSPGLQAAICGLCVDDPGSGAAEDSAQQQKRKATSLVDIALTAARSSRKKTQSNTFNTLVEALETVKKEQKKQRRASKGGGIGSWFSNTKPSSETSSPPPSARRTSSGDAEKPKSELPHNFASRAYKKGATDEAYRDQLFSGGANRDLSRAEKVEGQAAGFEDLKNELSMRGERLGKLSDKSEELANASEEFEKMCTQLNRQARGGSSGWW